MLLHGSRERVQSLYGVVGWSTTCIKFQNLPLSFPSNSIFSCIRRHFDWLLHNQRVFPWSRRTIVTDRTTIFSNRLLLAVRRSSSVDCTLAQDFLSPLRRMTTANDVDAKRSSAADTTQEQDDGLDGLENEFQNAVTIVSDDAVHSGKKISEQDTVPPMSSAIPKDEADTSNTTTGPKNVGVDNSKVSKSLRRIAALIDNAKNILILSGAGVSVAAGIPDFRTPGTGLYDNLKKYNLPYAEAVFDIEYYRINPKPFVQLATELWPDRHIPTITHSFIALLVDKQRLLRNYTQNIDGLESMAGVPDDRIVECHGHFRTASCIRCKKAASIESVKECIVTRQDVPICSHCTKSGSISSKKRPAYVKPDIVFFGEGLPDRFHNMLSNDTETADLCIVLGTSLHVPPTAYIPDMVDCPRILLNRELVGNFKISKDDDVDEYKSDLFVCGNCDDSIISIAVLLGWHNELRESMKK